MRVTDLTRPQLEQCFGRATGYSVPDKLSGVHDFYADKVEFYAWNNDHSYRTDLSMWNDGTMCLTGYDQRMKMYQSVPFNPRPLLAYLDSLGVTPITE